VFKSLKRFSIRFEITEWVTLQYKVADPVTARVAAYPSIAVVYEPDRFTQIIREREKNGAN
jgi:hypothetical protein